MRTSWPLHWQVAAIPATLALALVSCVLVLSQWLLDGYLEGRAAAGIRQAGAAFAHRLVAALEQRENELQMIASMEGQRGLDPAMLKPVLQWAQARYDGSRLLAVVDHDGRVIASTGSAHEGFFIEASIHLHDDGRRAWLGTPRMADPGQSWNAFDSQDIVLDMVIPIVASNGRRLGFLVSHIDWSWFVGLREPILGLDPQARREGMDLGIYSSGRQQLLSRMVTLKEADIVSMPSSTDAPGQPGYRKLNSSNGRELLATSIPVGNGRDRDWQVIAAQDLEVALLPSQALQQGVALIGVLAALMFGALGYWVSRRLMHPYEKLLGAMTQRLQEAGRPGSGGIMAYLEVLTAHARDLPVRFDAGGNASADAARRPLAPREVLALLAYDATRLELVLDVLPSGVMLCDPDFRVLYWNDACRRMFGWTDEEVLGRSPQSSFATGKAAGSMLKLQERLRHTSDVSAACELQRRDGTMLYCNLHAIRARDAAGHFAGYLLVADDVTARQQAQSRAEEMEANLRILVDAAADYAFVLLDDQGLIRSWSPAAQGMNAYPADELVGRSHELLFPDDDKAKGVPAALLQGARQAGRTEFEGWLLRRNGSRFWVNATYYCLAASEGTPRGFAMVARDLTERRDAQLRQHENQAMLAAIVDSASDAIISTDAAGRITLFNPAAERIFGHGADTMLGQPLDELIPAPYRDRHRRDLAAFADSMATRRRMGASGQVQGVRSDGSLLELEASISQIVINDRKFLTAILRDVTSRVRSQEALRQYQSELKALTQRLMTQEKETTQRIAQSLHDQLGQTLLAIRLSCEAARGIRRSSGDAQLQQLEDRIAALIAQAFVEVRKVLMDLRPPLLEEEGLEVALDNEMRSRSATSHGAQLVFEKKLVDGAVRWPSDVEYAAFMVAREAIGNALKHARAFVVRVTLEGRPDELVLRIEDDGVGLSGGTAMVKPGHLGMIGMRERALAIGAEFSIVARRTGGTQVELRWGARS